MTWVEKKFPGDPKAPVPHFLGMDGAVKAPSKWENVLKHSESVSKR